MYYYNSQSGSCFRRWTYTKYLPSFIFYIILEYSNTKKCSSFAFIIRSKNTQCTNLKILGILKKMRNQIKLIILPELVMALERAPYFARDIVRNSLHKANFFLYCLLLIYPSLSRGNQAIRRDCC